MGWRVGRTFGAAAESHGRVVGSNFSMTGAPGVVTHLSDSATMRGHVGRDENKRLALGHFCGGTTGGDYERGAG